MKNLIILASLLFSSVTVFGKGTYLDTLVKLRVPKKESKRSTEGEVIRSRPNALIVE
jgi:hypothetical protein